MNRELPDVQAGFRKGRGIRDQIANICWIIEKAREFQKRTYFCFIDAKAFDCVDNKELWKILKEMGVSDHHTCLLRNLYTGQEASVRTLCGTTHWFKIGKGICQGYILSSYLFNLYAEYIRKGNGTPLQYSCLENPMNGGTWWAAVHGVTKSQTRLSDFTFTFHFPASEKEMSTHSSILAWRIPGTEEPSGLPSVGLHRVGHN